MSLTAEDIALLSRLLDEGMDLGADEREQWLVGLPAEHAHLIDSVRDMLAKHADPSASGPLSTLPKIEAGLGNGGAAAGTLRSGQRIGPYELI